MDTAENLTPALVVAEVQNQAEHTEIAQTEDEDYKWLTDRLDEHSREIASLASAQSLKFQELTMALQANQEQSRLMIESLTKINETLTTNLTALSQSALLQSNLNNLESSSTVTENPTPETVVEVIEPANESIQEETPKLIKKRHRI